MDPNAEPGEGGDAPPAGRNEDRVGPTAVRTGAGRWDESSWDLRRGLSVHEGLPPDADRDEWLEAMLQS